ncbi:MAG TPA: cytidine deaminase [Gaiellaceae bacterium]|nr:cytidine deaminase [Gaiellaceae bacterium]
MSESSLERMLRLLPEAQRHAIPGISGFRVGCVAEGSSGSLYLGANVEYPGTALAFTVHAEQSATINAWQSGEEGLESIAVSAPPCGYCRQFLYELTTADRLVVHVAEEESRPLTELLPAAFGPADLDVEATLMSPQDHGLVLDRPSDDPLALAALAAANASYAPYSKGYAGVALQTQSGAVYAGRYAENAAFNPSVSPLESALVMRVLDGHADDAVTRAVLVETASKASQEGATRELLRVVSAAKLDLYQAA